MPHKCLNCGKVLEEDSGELMEGCSNCGQKLFVFEGKKKIDKKERNNIVKDVEDFLGNLEKEKEVKKRIEEAMEFDLESIKVKEPGVYEINLRKLLDEIPLIVEMKEGEYYIYLPSAFSKDRKNIRLDDLI